MLAPWPLDPGITALLFVAGYLPGSIPFGLILTRLAGLEDIRGTGSGNVGATNVLRSGSKGLAAATLLCDAAKGAVPVLLLAGVSDVAAAVAGVGALIGHIFPIWLKFRGGKGVATFLGVAGGFFWPLALLFGAIWLIVAAAFRYSSLAGMSAVILTGVAVVAFHGGWAAALFVIMSVIVVVAHRENLTRLRQGTESKIELSR